LFVTVASWFVGAAYFLNTPLNVVVVATLTGSATGGVVFWILKKEMSKPMLTALLLQIVFAIAIAWYGYTSGHASAWNAGLEGTAAMLA
jgi:ABC-type Mn2+/Zn2+ transport system permease subunit